MSPLKNCFGIAWTYLFMSRPETLQVVQVQTLSGALRVGFSVSPPYILSRLFVLYIFENIFSLGRNITQMGRKITTLTAQKKSGPERYGPERRGPEAQHTDEP
jgi:hypothetical protein